MWWTGLKTALIARRIRHKNLLRGPESSLLSSSSFYPETKSLKKPFKLLLTRLWHLRLDSHQSSKAQQLNQDLTIKNNCPKPSALIAQSGIRPWYVHNEEKIWFLITSWAQSYSSCMFQAFKKKKPQVQPCKTNELCHFLWRLFSVGKKKRAGCDDELWRTLFPGALRQ